MRTRKQDKPVEPTKRTTRKRSASIASVDVADTPSGSQAASQKQNKRRRRQESILEETVEETSTQDVVEYPDIEHPTLLEEGDDVGDTPSLRHVRFSETADDNGNGSTSTHLTPHVNKNKKTIHRRITISPATLASSSGISQRGKSRSSLPPNFTLPQDSPGRMQELQFRPLSQILQERVKRRLRRSHLSEETNLIHEENSKAGVRARIQLQQLHDEIDERDERVRQLLYELEMQRQLGIDVSDESDQERLRIRNMETELVTLKQEIEERRAQEAALPQIDGSEEMDIMQEDMLILNSPIVRSQSADISYPALGASQDTSTPSRRSTSRITERITIDDSQSAVVSETALQAEREAFEDAIRFWTREASDAKAALQILTIELQTLGFGDANTNAEAVISSIRESYRSIREGLEKALPGEVPADCSNGQLISLVADHLEALASKVADQNSALHDSEVIQEELAREIDGLVDRLSEAEVRKRELERRFGELDAQAQEDEVFIAELEEKLKEITKDHGIVQGMLNAKNSELGTLESANRELDGTVDKLGQALEGYRTSEEKLSSLIQRMEREHLHALADLESVHKTLVDSLEVTIATESSARNVAEADVVAKQVIITNLEIRIEQDSASIESLRQQLAIIEEERNAEQTARLTAEGEVDQRSTFIESLEIKIETAENDLESLRVELDRLRELNEAQNRQRVSAEEELDLRETKIEDLNNKLHEQGLQANQLRQKLFEIQVREKESVSKLEQDALDREEQFQDDMAAEIARREEAEATAASRNVTIVQVEEALKQAEAVMAETLEDRDQKITELAALNQRLESELENTTKELDNVITELETLQDSSEGRLAQLMTEVASLKTMVAEQMITISNLESEAVSTAEIHATAITDRDGAIANLNHEIFEANNLIRILESDKTSLEHRVESEAEAMLELQASKDDEIAALKQTITNKQAEVENLKLRATDVDSAWEKLIKGRDEEIEELQISSEASTKMVIRLTKLNTSLKEKLRKFVRDSTATSQAMYNDVEEAARLTAQKNGALREEGMRVLEEAESMEEISEIAEVQVQTSSASTSSSVKKGVLSRFKKASRGSKRQVDSGIGVDDSEETMLLE